MNTRRNPRAIAARVLGGLLSQRGSLGTLLAGHGDHEDAPLIQEICFGVCRNYFPLQAQLSGLLQKPLRGKDLDIHCLMLVGMYQLHYLRVPDHAAVNETVNAVAALGKPWARGLVNGILRQVTKARAEWLTLLESDDEELKFSHPRWLVELLKQDWPESWQEILEQNNLRAPMTLRVNLQRHSREAYRLRLQEHGIDSRPGRLAGSALYLAEPRNVVELPGFSCGDVSVQDEASQLVAGLLGLAPGLSCLDACAAPGGKTMHILESERSLTRLSALDKNPARLEGIRQNLARLGSGLPVDVRAADASRPEQWWDGAAYDRILLDAPCSATGVIRRHPDIKVLRRQEEIPALHERQFELLAALWPCLATGGRLLYTTCSVLQRENDATVGRFLAAQPDAKYRPIAADWGVECQFGRQLLPAREGSDGFYYSLLVKD